MHCGYQRLGSQTRCDVRQSRRDTATGEYITKPKQRPRDVTDEWAEGSFDIAVHPTAGRNAAATLSETDGHRSNRQSANQKCQRRVGTYRRGERSGHRENAGAHHDADDAGSKSPRTHFAYQPRVT